MNKNQSIYLIKYYVYLLQMSKTFTLGYTVSQRTNINDLIPIQAKNIQINNKYQNVNKNYDTFEYIFIISKIKNRYLKQ